jgi:hypothetical protein
VLSLAAVCGHLFGGANTRSIHRDELGCFAHLGSTTGVNATQPFVVSGGDGSNRGVSIRNGKGQVKLEASRSTSKPYIVYQAPTVGKVGCYKNEQTVRPALALPADGQPPLCDAVCSAAVCVPYLVPYACPVCARPLRATTTGARACARSVATPSLTTASLHMVRARTTTSAVARHGSTLRASVRTRATPSRGTSTAIADGRTLANVPSSSISRGRANRGSTCHHPVLLRNSARCA